MDAALAGPTPENIGDRFVVEGIVFDQRKGMGSVPDCANVKYMGFAVMMTPRTFLDLTDQPNRYVTSAGIEEAIRSGESVGSPFLDVELSDEGEVAVIWQHEGRNRMEAIGRLIGFDTEIPVCVLPRNGLRARHITDDMVESFREGAMSQRPGSRHVEGPLFGDAMVDGRTLTAKQPALGM